MQANKNTPKIKRKVKDSIFNDFFKDIKNLRKLYAALFPDNDSYQDKDFKIATLENILVDNIYNDLGFIVGNKLIILVEAQSTFNPNMPLRFMSYLANTYLNYILDNKLNIYGTKTLNLPTPKFYMIYTGNKKIEINKLRLSSLYDLEENETVPLELIVRVIDKYNTKNDIIREYIDFCQKFDELLKSKKYTKLEIIKKTIDYCIEHEILKEYLMSKTREVSDMMMQMITDEQAMDIILEEKYNIGIEQGIALGEKRGEERGAVWGRNEGRNEAMTAIISLMQQNGFSMEDICKNTGLNKEEVIKLTLSKQA